MLRAIILLTIGTLGGEPWSFTPPVRPSVPKVQDALWPRNPIDSFILEKLEAQGIRPTAEADRPTLIRRLSFDLTGLPPYPEEVDAFVNDPAADAYEKLVDRLLASPHYGERQAQHWLDLARYADTDGFEYDQARPEMWRYRDWVVSAFNRDLPYDRFVRLQLAGDEISPDDADSFIATGFNRLYPDMVDLNDQGLRRQNALNDITETTGAVFLGLTVGCARCHDHKTDPIKQTEFYSLQAFFAPAQFRDDFPVASKADRAGYEARRVAWETEVGRARSALNRIEAPVRARLVDGSPPNLTDEAARAFSRPHSERDSEQVRLVYEANRTDPRIKPEAVIAAFEASQGREWAAWKSRLDEYLKSQPPPLPKARGLSEKPGMVPATFLLKRGDFASKGAEVAPGFPRALASGRTAKIVPLAASSGRRSALADWLISGENPLVARVMVNRQWQGHFGRGIVATPGDFGAMGEEPSHPELLDWLASEFVARGWSLKSMHRLMVSSATYRQGSIAPKETRQLDPDNLRFSRHARKRLDGESLRDALLAVSGRLNRELGGPCVFPELPPELTRLSSHGAIWPVSTRLADRDRRSLYVFVRRNLRFPLFEAFDKPDTNASCPKRAVTTIAPQALALFNGPLANSCAADLAKRVEAEVPDLSTRIDRAYRRALGRSPDAAERALAGEFLKTATFADFCLALVNLNEFAYVE